MCGWCNRFLPPGVQHTEEADLGTEVRGVGGDGARRLRRRPEQDVVDHGLVLKCDRGNHIWHGEHDVEVGRVEQLRLTVLDPLRPCQTLALRAIAIAAGNGKFPLRLVTISVLVEQEAPSPRQASVNRMLVPGMQVGWYCSVRAGPFLGAPGNEILDHILLAQPVATGDGVVEMVVQAVMVLHYSGGPTFCRDRVAAHRIDFGDQGNGHLRRRLAAAMAARRHHQRPGSGYRHRNVASLALL